MTAEPRCWGGGGGVSHPSQLTTGLVIKSVTTSPTLAGERMLFILQVSILSEQTLNSRKLVSFPLIAHYLSAGPPLSHTPPFTGRPGHTHTYSSFLFSAPSKPVVLLAALTCYVCFALKALKLPVFSYELTLLTFSVSYLWIISYIYYIYVVQFTYFSVKKGGGGQRT